MNLNKLARQIHEQNVEAGWWDDPNPCIPTKLQLISTEIAEATEGERKNLMDNHLPHRKMGEVELADALIRTLDVGGRLGLKYINDLERRSLFNGESVAAHHLLLNRDLIQFFESLGGEGYFLIPSEAYTKLCDSFVNLSNKLGYDIESAMIEKLEYNKNRPDHKRENRQKPNGKEF